jgi:ribonuclease HI
MYRVYIDGSCRKNGTEEAIGGFGAVCYRDGKKTAQCSVRVHQPTTNNQMEYMALDHVLKRLKKVPETVVIHSDSKLVVNQVLGKWRVKDERLKILCGNCQRTMKKMRDVKLVWIPREENQEANDLAQLATEDK